eukprot:5509274-Pyramimonas_sp.AAC.1
MAEHPRPFQCVCSLSVEARYQHAGPPVAPPVDRGLLSSRPLPSHSGVDLRSVGGGVDLEKGG